MSAKTNSKPDAVLIDDDPLVHLTWSMAAKSKLKNVVTFFDAESFFAESAKIRPDTPIYVDSSLSNGVSGEDVAQKIHATGFGSVYLATGFPAERFKGMSWLSGVIGKTPPWL